MNPKEIGVFLKQLRKEKGITQEQLAEILGVSGRTVSRWETGNISFGIMFLICTMAILVQMIMGGELPLVIGKTIILIAGGTVYIFTAIRNGSWNGTMIKSTLNISRLGCHRHTFGIHQFM